MPESVHGTGQFQKQIFLFSFEPKNERNYFLNFALASKMSRIKKLSHLIILIRGFFFRFLAQMKTRKFTFETDLYELKAL